MNLPDRIFFTGVPGSRWSGIAQILESIPGFNISDRAPERIYDHHSYTGHIGAYFGQGMEFNPVLDPVYLDQAWKEPGGTRLVKSHDWAHTLSAIKKQFPNDWIMLVYRPDMVSYAWWHEAGGFQIKYPCYNEYKNSLGMLAAITQQNEEILRYACEKKSRWEYFTPEWVYEHFGHWVNVPKTYPDILVTIIK
jgi:hypothetical protein